MKMNFKDPIIAVSVFSTPETSNEVYEVISAEAVIVRADYIENDDKIKRISLSNGIKIFSLRSAREGGKYNGSLEERYARLINALEDYDIIEIEAATDLVPDVLRMIPAGRRIISWHGRADTYEEIENRFDQMRKVPAKYYQVIVEPRTISETIWPLRLLAKNSDSKLISYASGALGVWTQILSVYLGSKLIIGNIERTNSVENHLTCVQLKKDYNLPHIRNVKQIFGITGNPVFRSLSPLIHNKCYETLGMEALYLPFHIDNFDHFWQFISIDFPNADLGLTLGGFTMVSPYKEDTFNAAKGHLSKPTLSSKACNILINNNGDWNSDSSDGLGVIAVLNEAHRDLNGLNVAIIGCGGAGRTIAARLKGEGANIVMYNRSIPRGEFASELLSLPFHLISEFDASAYDIVINATPVGKLGKKLIFDPSNLKSHGIAIDMAYAEEDTLLVSNCRKHGKHIIEGKKILLYQVKKQFTGLTGMEMPLEVELMVREKTANLLKMN